MDWCEMIELNEEKNQERKHHTIMMGEYQEDSDVADLLEGDSDDDYDSSQDSRDVHNLLSLDDVSITGEKLETRRNNIDLMFLPGLTLDPDDEDEEEAEKDNVIEDAETTEQNRKKWQNLLHNTPPGVNIFRY